MGPGDLSRALAALPEKSDPRLLVGREHGLRRPRHCLICHERADFIARVPCLLQSIQHIGSHEWIGFVISPPTPSAIGVLHVLKTGQAVASVVPDAARAKFMIINKRFLQTGCYNDWVAQPIGISGLVAWFSVGKEKTSACAVQTLLRTRNSRGCLKPGLWIPLLEVGLHAPDQCWLPAGAP